jgi:sugar phosphate isomerase/epimerase
MNTPFPFRLGTTSYIIPDDILPNVRWLVGQVQDVELVLFEVDDGASNLPDQEVLSELSCLAKQHGLSYTVHLPLDIRLGDNGETGHVSMLKARRVIECTRELDPFAYVVHLDGSQIKEDMGTPQYDCWVNQSVRALNLLANWAGNAERLAVENLEHYPFSFWNPVFERSPVSRCLDVGHLWLDGVNTEAILKEHLPRTRVVHLHGINGRDHKSLAALPLDKTRQVVDLLCEQPYSGVLTLEVFNQIDFESSMDVLMKVRERQA